MQCIESLSDSVTPVEMYLKVRARYPVACLLESSDYKSKENSYSFLAFDPIASLKIQEQQVHVQYLTERWNYPLTDAGGLSEVLLNFLNALQPIEPSPIDFFQPAVIGYMSYEAVPLIEDISLQKRTPNFPVLQYHFFRKIIIFDHFYGRLYAIEHLLEGEAFSTEEWHYFLHSKNVQVYPFRLRGDYETDVSDETFLGHIEQAKAHCQRGDVFQLVLSRQFRQAYEGDDFQVYRALRAINPSPYLFYFDYGNCKLMGSSPEAQVRIEGERAVVKPIAGTFRREPNHETALIQKLLIDHKENAEHHMLVDLARNDLGRVSQEVQVAHLKQVELYSHVIHLVSEVQARVHTLEEKVRILLETFPAGTLTGAPKYRAMQLIDTYEPQPRAFYGGTVGLIQLNGNMNHAIFIRSLWAEQNQLHFQAGCGIVIASHPQNELQEIYNKTLAIQQALKLAQSL